MTSVSNSEDGIRRSNFSEWKEEWRAFQTALRDPRQPFNPWTWIVRLGRAFLTDASHLVGVADWIERNNDRIVRLKSVTRPVVPTFGLALIVLVAFSYFASLRQGVVQTRWCCEKHHTNKQDNVDPSRSQDTDSVLECSTTCSWILLHDAIVIYLFVMTLFHFLSALFSSPGVNPPNPTTLSRQPWSWKATNGQGGLWGLNVPFDEASESARVASFYNYSNLGQAAGVPSVKASSPKQEPGHHAVVWNPSPDPSYCQACACMRPPRCHHCRSCQRCILQMDHHCVWLNNCIGYNNYRSFFLTVFFLTVACWYGVVMLFLPCYEPLRQQVRENGWRWTYSNGTGFLNLPPLLQLLDMLVISRQGWPLTVVIHVVYPLLAAVGAILSLFLGQHVKYIITARTTIEHMAVLDDWTRRLWIRLETSAATGAATMPRSSSEQNDFAKTWVNPFDQGWLLNFKQILGPNLLWALLPVPVTPPPPFLPHLKRN